MVSSDLDRATQTDPGLAVAADVGGTNLRVGLVDRAGSIRQLVVTPTPTGDVDIIDALSEHIASVIAPIEASDDLPLAGVGVGLPGRLIDNGEHWSMALNLGVSTTVKLRSRLEMSVPGPLWIGNDVALSALGAAHHYAHIDRIAYLSVGTGVAGGVMNRTTGRRIDLDRQFVGEVGHLPVPGLETECPCGQTGCVESAAGGGAMLRRWHAVEGHALDDVADVWDAADGGHPEACAIRDDCVRAIAWVAQLYTVAFGADAVVVGGGVSLLGGRLHGRVVGRLDEVERTSPLMASFDLAGRVRVAPAGSEFGLLGAAQLVFASGTME